MVVPAEDRKTADHWDFERPAVCIPLVSAAGHGKADIKRIHYQEGKFALASTMCALFVKNEQVVRPRYLHIYLNAVCNDVLVPLMCGATNVTMSSDQLTDVLIPVPDLALQDQAIQSHLVMTKANEMMLAAIELRDSSPDTAVATMADDIIHQTEELIGSVANSVQVSDFLPSRDAAT
jgi:type I restriction enzyme M protein